MAGLSDDVMIRIDFAGVVLGCCDRVLFSFRFLFCVGVCVVDSVRCDWPLSDWLRAFHLSRSRFRL